MIKWKCNLCGQHFYSETQHDFHDESHEHLSTHHDETEVTDDDYRE